jgi:hypothetical protein
VVALTAMMQFEADIDLGLRALDRSTRVSLCSMRNATKYFTLGHQAAVCCLSAT